MSEEKEENENVACMFEYYKDVYEDSVILFSRYWERFDNAHLKDTSKHIIVYAYPLKTNNDLTNILKIYVNGNYIYMKKMFLIHELEEKFKNVKTFKQFKKVLADILIGE